MSVELESAKRLNALKAKADAKTGESSDTLSEAVDTLIAGFGQGGGGGSGTDVASYLKDLQYSFTGVDFTGNPNVVLSLLNVPRSCANAFNGSTGVETITLKSPTGSVPGPTMFSDCSAKMIDLTDFKIQFTTCSNMFSLCKQLTEIKGELDLSLCTNVSNMFRDAGVPTIPLTEVRFKAGTINLATNMWLNQADKLSDASIQSIIDGLADLTGSTAQTLTLHADVKSKLTDGQITTITGKNWTLA